MPVATMLFIVHRGLELPRYGIVGNSEGLCAQRNGENADKGHQAEGNRHETM